MAGASQRCMWRSGACHCLQVQQVQGEQYGSRCGVTPLVLPHTHLLLCHVYFCRHADVLCAKVYHADSGPEPALTEEAVSGRVHKAFDCTTIVEVREHSP